MNLMPVNSDKGCIVICHPSPTLHHSDYKNLGRRGYKAQTYELYIIYNLYGLIHSCLVDIVAKM